MELPKGVRRTPFPNAHKLTTFANILLRELLATAVLSFLSGYALFIALSGAPPPCSPLSLQRTLGGSSKQPTSHTVPVQGRSPHHFQQPAVSQGQGSAVARATAAAARREKAAKSLARAADENDANSAARLATRLKAEEDAESVRVFMCVSLRHWCQVSLTCGQLG